MKKNSNGKKSKWKQLNKFTFGIVMALVLVLSACSGNGGTSGKDKTEPTPSSSSNTSAPGNNEGKSNEGEDKPVYPLNTKDTFSYWAPINGNLITFTTNLAEAPIGKAIAEATGVKVEYIHPTDGQAGEQFNLLLASSIFFRFGAY